MTRAYSISRAAGLVDCPADWLRQRDAILNPIKDQAGRRLYTDEHIALARTLRRQSVERPRAA